jgi:Fe-S-cluster containining protein
VSLEALRFAAEERKDARAALALLDTVPRAPAACAPGCAFCCHLPVLVTPKEAELLAEVASRRPGVKARLHEPGPRCPFLSDENRCVAYDVRPLRCRAHTSGDRLICERVFRGELPLASVGGDPWLRLAAQAIGRGLGEGEHELRVAVREALLGVRDTLAAPCGSSSSSPRPFSS